MEWEIADLVPVQSRRSQSGWKKVPAQETVRALMPIFLQEEVMQLFEDSYQERVQKGIDAVAAGRGVIVVDDENRENEGDLIFAAESLTEEQMALLIRRCSGIVCLCMTEDRMMALDLPQMVEKNTCVNRTAFAVTIEAVKGVTTGVSAKDRTTTIRTAVAEGATPADLNRPGHVFPLCARSGGVLERGGHTEATVDLMRLAGLAPCGVLCELMNDDGTMMRGEQLVAVADKYNMPILQVADLVKYRKAM